MTLTDKENLIKELATLPTGTIVKRTIRGAMRFYHQWREEGKTKSKYLSVDELSPLRKLLDRRKAIDAILKGKKSRKVGANNYSTFVAIGERLLELTASSSKYEKREEIKDVVKHIRSLNERPLIISGNLLVGKTIFLHHIISALKEETKTVLISLTEADSLYHVRSDIENLKNEGVKFFFIDNVNKFKEREALLSLVSDNFSRLGLSFILSDNKTSDFRFENIRLKHLASSDIIIRAFENIEKAKAFFSEQLNKTAFNRLEMLTRNVLFEEANKAAVDDLVDDGWLMKCQAEVIGKHKKASELYLFTYPHLRRIIGNSLIKSLLQSDTFLNHGVREKKVAKDTLIDALEERILEETILIKAIKKNPNNRVVLLLFPGGGRAFVIVHEDELTCELFVVSNKETRDEEVLFDLSNPSRLDAIEHRYGLITARKVLYRGRTARHSTGILFESI